MYNAASEFMVIPPRDLVRPPDAVRIRGTTLNLSELVDRRYFEPERMASLRARLQAAQPFPHLVVEDLFNPRLLELVAEEFDQCEWCSMRSAYESTRRMALGSRMGPASQLYFDIVNSGWFSTWVSDIIGVPYLLTDPRLFGGGLHETRPGDGFNVHLDFSRHRHVGLHNAMVFITYLNKNWQSEWGGALELWDTQQCVTRVKPEFGHTLLMPHSRVSYHGHPGPMAPPDGRPRRSVAAYYYTGPDAGATREDEVSSRFLRTRPVDQVKRLARMVAPPLLWSALRMLRQDRGPSEPFPTAAMTTLRTGDVRMR